MDYRDLRRLLRRFWLRYSPVWEFIHRTDPSFWDDLWDPKRGPGNTVDGAGGRRERLAPDHGRGHWNSAGSAGCGDGNAQAAHTGRGRTGGGGRIGGNPTRLLELPLPPALLLGVP